jgi:hypothetical protein
MGMENGAQDVTRSVGRVFHMITPPTENVKFWIVLYGQPTRRLSILAEAQTASNVC